MPVKNPLGHCSAGQICPQKVSGDSYIKRDGGNSYSRSVNFIREGKKNKNKKLMDLIQPHPNPPPHKCGLGFF